LASKAIEFGEKMQIRAVTSFKVIEVGISRKPVCYFLLVINSPFEQISSTLTVSYPGIDSAWTRTGKGGLELVVG